MEDNVSKGACPLLKQGKLWPVDTVSRSEALLLFYYLYPVGDECKLILGHLPFCASLSTTCLYLMLVLFFDVSRAHINLCGDE